MTLDTLLNGFWDMFKSVLPYLLTGMVAIWIGHLRNRNERERVITDAERTKIDAQKLINTQFEKFVERTDKLAKDLADTREKASEEKGSLKQQILDLTEQLQVERNKAEGRSETNARDITQLQTQIAFLTEQTRLLQEQVNVVKEEREALNKTLQSKIVELETARILLQQTQAQVETLMTETGRLRDMIEAKDKELAALRQRIGEPT